MDSNIFNVKFILECWKNSENEEVKNSQSFRKKIYNFYNFEYFWLKIYVDTLEKSCFKKKIVQYTAVQKV